MKLLLAVLMIMTSVVFGIRISTDIQKNEGSEEKTESDLQKSVIYVLKYEDGNIFLYEDEQIIETISEINISTLPFSDREDLCEGIILESAEEAYRLIEDLDGWLLKNAFV